MRRCLRYLNLDFKLKRKVILLFTLTFLALPLFFPLILEAEASDLAPSSVDITKTQTYPSLLFNGKPISSNITVSYRFTTKGQISYSLGNETVTLMPSLPPGVISTQLYSNETHVMTAYTLRIASVTKAYLEVYADFNKAKNSVKWTLTGTQDISDSLSFSIPFGKYAKLLDKNGKRAWFGSGLYRLGYDWGDATGITASYTNSTQSLIFTIGRSFSIDPVTVATTTTQSQGGETQTPNNQIRNFISSNGRRWVSLYNGTHVVLSNSTDSTNFSAGVLLHSTAVRNDWSFYYDPVSDKVHAVWRDVNQDVRYMNSSSIGTTISWYSPVTIDVPASGGTDRGVYVALDSNNVPFIGLGHYEGGENKVLIYKATSATGQAWDSGTVVDKTTYNGSGYLVLLSLGSSKMIVLYTGNQSGTYYMVWQSIYSGSSWGTPTAAPFSSLNPYNPYFGAVTDSSNNVHLVNQNYSNSNALVYAKFTASSQTWGAGSIVNSSSVSYVRIARDDNNILYAQFIVSGVIWEHKYGASWVTATKPYGSTFTSPVGLSLSLRAVGGKINSLWIEGNESPYNVRYAEETVNIAPTIGQFVASSSIYAGKYGWVNVTAKDVNGQSDISKVFLALTVGSETFKVKYVSGAFSEATDTNNRITVDASTSTRLSVNSTSYKYAFYMRFAYNATRDSSVDIVSGTGVQDALSAVGNATQTGLFAYENRVEVQSLTVDSSSVDPSTTLTFTPTVEYYSTAIGVVNLDTYLTVKIRLSGSDKGSSSTFTSNGAASISFPAESSSGTYTYTAYVTPISLNQQNRTVDVIVKEKTGGATQPTQPTGGGGGYPPTTTTTTTTQPPSEVTPPTVPVYKPPGYAEYISGFIVLTLGLAFGAVMWRRRSGATFDQIMSRSFKKALGKPRDSHIFRSFHKIISSPERHVKRANRSWRKHSRPPKRFNERMKRNFRKQTNV